MHEFTESAQRTPTRQAVSATPSLNAVLIIRVIIDSTVLCIVLHTVHRNFQKVQLLVNAFGVFGAFYRGHFSYDFHKQGVTLDTFWQQNVYFRFNHSYWIFAHGWFLKPPMN